MKNARKATPFFLANRIEEKYQTLILINEILHERGHLLIEYTIVRSCCSLSMCGTMHFEKTSVDSNSRRSFPLPQYQPNDLQIWFMIVEDTFKWYRIEDENLRYDCLIKHLPPDVKQAINMWLQEKSNNAPYSWLKRILMAKFEEPGIKRLRNLFINLQMENRKPSDLIKMMRKVIQERNLEMDLDTGVLRQIWLEKLTLPYRLFLYDLPESGQLDKEIIEADKAFQYWSAQRNSKEQHNDDVSVEEIQRSIYSLSVAEKSRSRSPTARNQQNKRWRESS